MSTTDAPQPPAPGSHADRPFDWAQDEVASPRLDPGTEGDHTLGSDDVADHTVRHPEPRQPSDYRGFTQNYGAGEGVRNEPLVRDVDDNPVTLRDLPRAFRSWFGMARERIRELNEVVEPRVRRIGAWLVRQEVEVPPLREADATGTHAETFGLDFTPVPTRYGDYERDGFVAFNRNDHSGQDAFAVNSDLGRFVVADGAGGSGRGPLREATGRLSKELSDAVAADILNPMDRSELNAWLQGFRRRCEADGLGLNNPDDRDAAIVSTLSVVDIGPREPDGSVRVGMLGIGDSPIYVLDARGNVVQTFGEDEELRRQGGTPTNVIHNAVGLNNEGAPIMPRHQDLVVLREVTLQPGEWIVVGSDYLSKYLDHQRDTRIFNRIRASRSARDFVDAIGADIDDDATAIVIDPARMATQV